MAHIGIWKVARYKEQGCSLTESKYDAVFMFEGAPSIDRFSLHPLGNNKMEVRVSTSGESAIFTLENVVEVMSTTDGQLEIYFTGDYTKTNF